MTDYRRINKKHFYYTAHTKSVSTNPSHLYHFSVSLLSLTSTFTFALDFRLIIHEKERRKKSIFSCSILSVTHSSLYYFYKTLIGRLCVLTQIHFFLHDKDSSSQCQESNCLLFCC